MQSAGRGGELLGRARYPSFFFFQAEDGIRDLIVTGVQTCALPIWRPRRTLSLADRLVRVPIGFLWLGVLTIVALPVMIYMTCLYWGVRWTSALFPKNRATRANRADREERVA